VKPEELVAQVFGLQLDEVGDDCGPDSVEDWDSLGHLNLLMEIEEVYGISLSTDDALEIVDVQSLRQVLTERGATW
jgi:acyl carrier protein